MFLANVIFQKFLRIMRVYENFFIYFINYFESFLINKQKVVGNNIIETFDKVGRSELR